VGGGGGGGHGSFGGPFWPEKKGTKLTPREGGALYKKRATVAQQAGKIVRKKKRDKNGREGRNIGEQGSFGGR